jgi:tryptophan 2,3-dioxygenase
MAEEGDVAEAARLLRRPLRCMRVVTDQLDMLEELSPWEYQEIRKVLGRLVQTVVFPELWEVRNELTARSKAESDSESV